MPLSTFADTLRHVVGMQNRLSHSSTIGTDGIDVLEAVVISVLADGGTLTMKELSRSLSVKENRIEKLLGNLLKKGVVQTTVNAATTKAATTGDAVSVALTDRGREIHERLEAKFQEVMDRNPESRAALRDLRSGAKAMRGIVSKKPSGASAEAA